MGSAVKKATNTAGNLFHDAQPFLFPLLNPANTLNKLKGTMPSAPTLPNTPVPTVGAPPTPQPTETPQTSALARLRRIQAMRYGFSSTLNTASAPMPMAPTGGKTAFGS